MANFLAPDPIQSTQFIPGTNTPANGGQIFFYSNLSSTKVTVYKGPTTATAWTNPIVLDSGGNLPSGGEVWLQSGTTYTAKFCPANDGDPPTSPYWTKDNLSGINDFVSTDSEWIQGPTPTFVSGTSFTLSGDQTGTFTFQRRIKSINTGGTIYSTISAATFGGGITTVTLVNDSGNMDAGLSQVFYGIISMVNASIPYNTSTWTPGISFGASTTGITYSSQFGHYMKIGSLVMAQFHVDLSSTGVALIGIASLTGLPFYSINDNTYFPVGVVRWTSMNSTFVNMWTRGFNSTKAFQLFGITASSDTAGGALSQGQFDNNAGLEGTIVYLTTA